MRVEIRAWESHTRRRVTDGAKDIGQWRVCYSCRGLTLLYAMILCIDTTLVAQISQMPEKKCRDVSSSAFFFFTFFLVSCLYSFAYSVRISMIPNSRGRRGHPFDNRPDPPLTPLRPSLPLLSPGHHHLPEVWTFQFSPNFHHRPPLRNYTI
jgi:hypothetical protein